MLTIGDRFPDFDLQATVGLERDHQFTRVTNKSFPGKWLVVFSWPMDFTFVCPTEIAEFGNPHGDFQDRDPQVLGRTTDPPYLPPACRRAPPARPALPYPMLADPRRDLS